MPNNAENFSHFWHIMFNTGFHNPGESREYSPTALYYVCKGGCSFRNLPEDHMTIFRNLLLVGLLISMLGLSSPAYAGGSTIIVNTTSDIEDFGGAKTMTDLPGPDGVVSLREAINAANNTTGPNTIAFNIPTTDPGFGFSGFSGTFVIFVEGAPLIVRDSYTTTDARTQTALTRSAVPEGAVVHIRTT